MIMTVINAWRAWRWHYRHGYWCEHPYFEKGQWIRDFPYGGHYREDGWHMRDVGMGQFRHCALCGVQQSR